MLRQRKLGLIAICSIAVFACPKTTPPALSPTITAPDAVTGGKAGQTASVDAHPGTEHNSLTYHWTITGGTITDGQDSSSITFTSDADGAVQLTVRVLDELNIEEATATKSIEIVPLQPHFVVPAAISEGKTYSTSVPTVTGSTYAWFGNPGIYVVRTSGGAIGLGPEDAGSNWTSPNLTFAAHLDGGTADIESKVTNRLGDSATASATFSIVQLDATITAPSSVPALQPGQVASVAAGAASYVWAMTNGGIDAGQSTNSITFTPGASGSMAISIRVTNSLDDTATSAVTIPIVTSGALSLSQFCSSYFTARLNQYASCTGSPVDAVKFQFTRMNPDLVCPDVTASADGGRTNYDDTKAQDCLNEIAGQTCEQSVTPNPTDPCLTVLVGQVPKDGSCYIAGECTAGTYCTAGPGHCPGTCAAETPALGTCGSSTAVPCVQGTSCVAGTCQAQAAEGGSCSFATGPLCAPGLWCTAGASSTGTCMAQHSTGACTNTNECSFGSQCVGGACVPPLSIGGSCATRQCAPFLDCGTGSLCEEWPGLGGSCGVVGTHTVGCINSYCTGSSGTCQPQIAAGNSCPSAFTNPCVDGVCLSGQCTSNCHEPP
jgi:hypothetical protein